MRGTKEGKIPKHTRVQIIETLKIFSTMQRFDVGQDTECAEIYAEAAAYIQSGRLVAFPTETVYGLGGNGLNADAVKRIFEVKRRPANDPVILHFVTKEAARRVWNVSGAVMEVIEAIQDAFWPGPCTIVAHAAEMVPTEVTSGTGYVACRSPKHPVARRLIEAAGVPIAAPSANLFSRISPTKADHVWKYFSQEPDVLLLACDNACEFGIESSVIKVDDDQNTGRVTVEVLRAGAVTLTDLQAALTSVEVFHRAKTVALASARAAAADKSVKAEVAPGQCLVHYAPKLPTYLFVGNDSDFAKIDETIGCPREHLAILNIGGCAEIDDIKSSVHRIFAVGNSSSQPLELAAGLYGVMHEIEEQLGQEGAAKAILIGIDKSHWESESSKGMVDRLTRAAGGKFIPA